MFDISSFLKSAFESSPDSTPLQPSTKSYLPEIELSPKLKKDIEQISLDFLTGMYFSAKKTGTITHDAELWFLEEINHGLHIVYPNKTRREYTVILQQIIRMSDPNYGVED